MNQLTAIFMQQLSDDTSLSEEILERVRKELVLELLRCLPKEMHPGTLYCSAEGENLKSQMLLWKEEAAKISKPSDAVRYLRSLKELCQTAKRLREETCQQIESYASVDGGKLHLFYAEEQRSVLKTVNEWIRIDLYRILILGGPAYFRKIPLLKKIPMLLLDRVRYYKTQVMPVLSLLDARQRYSYWAVQHKDECRMGPLATLPAYVLCEPAKRSERLMPGEYKKLEALGGVMYQGLGRLTNITPDTIEEAQSDGLYDHVPMEAFEQARGTQDPVKALETLYAGKWYAVDPYELFSKAAAIEASWTILRRGQLRQCLYCGSLVEHHVPLCPQCIKRIKVR